MKTKYAILTIVILSMIFSLGAQCSAGGKKAASTENPFYQSNEGLAVELQPLGTVRPKEAGGNEVIYQSDSMSVEVEIQNKGEAPVEANEVELFIEGIAQGDFPSLNGITTPLSNKQKIPGVSQMLPQGGYDTVNFGSSPFSGNIGNFYDANIYIRMVYPYWTRIIIPQVCFKEDPRDDTVCNLEGSKVAYSSGGPLQVTKVTQRTYGRGKILLEIGIKNVGGKFNAQAVGRGRSKSQNSPVFSNLYDEARIAEVKAVHPFSCTSRGRRDVVRMTQYEGIIRCVLDQPLPKRTVFTSPVEIKLDYDYESKISKIVRILIDPSKLGP